MRCFARVGRNLLEEISGPTVMTSTHRHTHTPDVQMQTNHLSHFLLTKELFPLLNLKAEAVGEARIVNHSSMAAWMDDEPLDGKYYGKNGGSLQQLIPISTWHAYAFTHAHTCSCARIHTTHQATWVGTKGRECLRPKTQNGSAISNQKCDLRLDGH